MFLVSSVPVIKLKEIDDNSFLVPFETPREPPTDFLIVTDQLSEDIYKKHQKIWYEAQNWEMELTNGPRYAEAINNLILVAWLGATTFIYNNNIV